MDFKVVASLTNCWGYTFGWSVAGSCAFPGGRVWASSVGVYEIGRKGEFYCAGTKTRHPTKEEAVEAAQRFLAARAAADMLRGTGLGSDAKASDRGDL